MESIKRKQLSKLRDSWVRRSIDSKRTSHRLSKSFKTTTFYQPCQPKEQLISSVNLVKRTLLLRAASKMKVHLTLLDKQVLISTLDHKEILLGKTLFKKQFQETLTGMKELKASSSKTC
jgi:hypothetical protein